MLHDISTQVKCPTCGKYIAWSKEQPWRPFCSERCRVIDLGGWADESYRISDNKADTDNNKQQ